MSGFEGGLARGIAKGLALKEARGRTQARTDIAKQQAKLLEMQLQQGQIKIDANTKLSDLLTGSIGEVERTGTQITEGGRAIPTLEPTGQEPQNLSQILADPEGQLALLQSGQLNVKDFMGKAQNDPSAVATLKAAGIDPQSEEGKKILVDSLTDNSQDLLRSLQAQVELFALEDKREDRRRSNLSRRQTLGRAKLAIGKEFKDAKEIIQLQQDLEKSALAVGTPYGDFVKQLQAGSVAALELVGFDQTEARTLIDKRNRLNKLFASGTLEALDIFTGTGAVTNEKFNALRLSTPSADNTSGANGLLLADRLEAALDGAQIEEMDISDRADIESFINELRTTTFSSPAEAVIDVPAITKMTMEQLSTLDPAALTEEARAAAERRWDELNGGR